MACAFLTKLNLYRFSNSKLEITALLSGTGKCPPVSRLEMDPKTNGGTCTNGAKRAKLSEFTISQTVTEKLTEMKQAWGSGKEFEDAGSGCRLSSTPFQHCELGNFFAEPKVLDSFIETAYSDEVTFLEKSSDLFQFKQSLDLATIDFPGLEEMRTFFNDKIFHFVKDLTGLPLNGHVDMFLSEYQQTDHLLCHDDELESRRIAFILYLNRDWQPDYGGTLDLFGAVEFPLAPTTVQTSITPEFNKFVFFDVSCRSFHQVSEVLKSDVRRLALSGWFLGVPLPRPEADICNPIFKSVGMLQGAGAINPTYLDASTQSSINAQLEADSEVLLVDFLTPEHYQDVLKELKDTVKWSEKGAPNVEHCLEAEVDTANKLKEIFDSKELHTFLEALTEFDFGAPNTKVIKRLSKYGHKCYQLVRHQREAAETEKDDDEEEEDEPQLIDIVYFAGDFECSESHGGEIIYVDGEGEHLITVTPHPNSLAVIVRGSSVSSYVRYINCNAGQASYSAYRATYTFDNEID